ncbi:MAG: type IX secretion system membrane protein PorP/SprF [Chitinophagaceae bacterium]|jgi:type IX secretion system PorP/SprF family membrane protein
MKHFIKYTAIAVSLLSPSLTKAQTTVTPHYSMFMYNKLIYNPGYAGSRDATCVNALYRSQWVGIDGAPRNFSVSIDGPVGSYMKPFRHVALGLSVNNETAGVLNNTNIMAYYAYRIKMKNSMLSFGLQAGTSMLSAKYSELNPYQSGDASLTKDLKNEMLPNFGAGVYWRGDKFYLGASVPNLLENKYDKDNKAANSEQNKQVRSYYLSGGYVFTLSESFKLEPQVLFRYAGNGTYNLPASADFNLSAIFYDRIMIGATYRTDQSVAAIVHLQATKNINVGYSYDYATKVLNGYNSGSHEVTLGFDFVRDNNKYINPRFIKLF